MGDDQRADHEYNEIADSLRGEWLKAMLTSPRETFQRGRIAGHDEEQAEALRLRDALTSIATLRQEADDWEHPDFDWRYLARKMEAIARIAVHLVEPDEGQR